MALKSVMRLCVLLGLAVGLCWSTDLRAQEPKAQPAKAPAEAAPTEKSKEVPLEVGQQVLAKRFEQFQNTLLQMAEQMRKTDPDRAELIFRALSKSQEERVSGQMKVIEELLTKKQFGSAIGRQDDLTKSLFTLLELLQSENRLNEIDAERKRIEALLKDVNKLIGKEKDARAATERGTDADKAAGQQKDVSDETKKVADKIDKQDAQKRAEQESKNSKSPSGDAQSQDGKQQDGKQQDGKSSDPKDGKKSDGKQSDSKDGSKNGEKKDGSKDGQDNKDNNKKGDDDKDSSKNPGQKNDKDKPEKKDDSPKNSDGQKSDGQPMQGQQGDPMPGQQGKPMPGQQGQQQNGPQQQQQQQKTPGREDLEQAREEMQRAIEDLKKLDRDKASRHQDEAIKRLLEAKEKFEEILRQLREEEKKLTLTALEARFRKMLAQQLLVYNDTIVLSKTGKKDDPTYEAKSKQLARNEDEIVVEAEKALVLLKSEGSSVAFPDAAEAIRDDMSTIAQRLDKTDPGELTQTIERNVIEALEEMIDALQKEIEKQKDKDKQQQQQQQQQQQDEPLVDALAELKMLRSLQLRINRQTKQLGRLIEGEQSTEPEVVEQLQTLSRRQAKIQQATYDLATGRNK